MPGGAHGSQGRLDAGRDLRTLEHEHHGPAARGRQGQSGQVGEVAGTVDHLAVAELAGRRGVRGEPDDRPRAEPVELGRHPGALDEQGDPEP